jgi:hypothetical protein
MEDSIVKLMFSYNVLTIKLTHTLLRTFYNQELKLTVLIHKRIFKSLIRKHKMSFKMFHNSGIIMNNIRICEYLSKT